MSSALATPLSVDPVPDTPDEARTVRNPLPHQRSRRPLTRTHLLAVPDPEPPFDDEVSSATVHTLNRTALLPAPERSADPEVDSSLDPDTIDLDTRAFRAAGTTAAPLVARAVPDQSRSRDFGIRLTPRSELPPAPRVALALAGALMETLTGYRPLRQLEGYCTPPVFAGLTARTPLPGSGLARLQSVHTSEPTDGVAEVCMVVRRNDRCRAIAFRLAGIDGRWRMTALQIG